jgi:hypothetical protein
LHIKIKNIAYKNMDCKTCNKTMSGKMKEQKSPAITYCTLKHKILHIKA